MSFHHGVIEKASLEEKINEVICQPIDRNRKSSLVQLIKETSFVESGKATSLQTIFSVSNTMVGTSTIVFPVLFH
jgi:sodium-coupled neutral amino acid transporter 9